MVIAHAGGQDGGEQAAALNALDQMCGAAASAAKDVDPHRADAAGMGRLMTRFERFMASVDETA
jgi:hypothetical protein